MGMRRYRGRFVFGTVATLLLLLAWSLFFGRLSPFVPWVLLSDQMATKRAIIYHYRPESTKAFADIDSHVAAVERYHRLKFRRKPEIVVARSDRAYEWITGTGVRFVTTPLRGRIQVSPRAEADYLGGRIRFDTYIRHELSHALLYQNMTFLHTLTYPGWFMEGLAMVSAGQVGTDGYFTYEKAFETLKAGYFVEPYDWGTAIRGKGRSVTECPLANKYWFIYSEFALIVRDLMETYGEEKFFRFVKSSLDGEPFDDQFRAHFGTTFPDFLERYRSTAISGPRP